MKSVHLELPEDLLARVDEAAGDIPRNRWIRRAIVQALPPQFPTDDNPPPIVKRIREHWGEDGYDPTAPANRADAFRQATQRKGK